MRINTNVNAMVAVNQMAKNTALQGNSMEKLSTGLRINKAGDDAAGLAISEKMRSQIRGMEQADRNVQDGISLIQTAEGSLEEATNIAQRMRELVIQGANDTNTDSDREKINTELAALTDELANIATESKFNEKSLLSKELLNENGSAVDLAYQDSRGNQFIAELQTGVIALNTKGVYDETEKIYKLGTHGYVNSVGKLYKDNSDGTFILTTNAATTGTFRGDIHGINSDTQSDIDTVKIQAGANLETRDIKSINLSGVAEALSDIRVSVSTNFKTDTLGTTMTNNEYAKASLKKIDEQLAKMNTARAEFGAQQNRLEYTQSNLQTSNENLTTAESRIRDVDVAKEMVKLSKLNIITQASQSMAAQAKQQPQGVMQLLQ